MQTFVMLTRLSPDALKSPKSLQDLEQQAMNKVRSECPNVEWVHNFAILGPYDYVDVFRAPDELTAFKVATLIRTFGHCTTEIWIATEWARFKNVISDLAKAA
jgi:uncharacterized protein with GYD domain